MKLFSGSLAADKGDDGIMIRVKLSTNFPEWPLIRQTPGRSGIWGECQFFINEEIEECDFWVVYDDVIRPETTRCPPGNTLLITGEPPSVKRYPRRYAAQFARVLTCHRELKHPHVIYSQQALPWMVGCRYIREKGQWEPTYNKDYDELSGMAAVPKTKLLSVISSNKRITPGHEQRLAFVEALKQRFGSDIDVFGRGVRDVEDKWDAIAPYRYHVVIENGQFPDYWTEKLSDAIFAGAYPLYVGCPNTGTYFAENMITSLDLTNFEGSLKAIADAIESSRYECTVQERRNAEVLLLNKYNLFAVITDCLKDSARSITAQKLTIQPSQHFVSQPLKILKDLIRPLIKR
ncbi:MAG: glycosyltransferase family 10 domain-containing protein [Janthinobacterium lividum]